MLKKALLHAPLPWRGKTRPSRLYSRVAQRLNVPPTDKELSRQTDGVRVKWDGSTFRSLRARLRREPV